MKSHYLILFISCCLFSCSKPQYPIVEIETSLGSIELEIYENKAPITAKHFLANIDNKVVNRGLFL